MPDGGTVSDSDSAELIVAIPAPGISIDKTSDTQTVISGETMFTITVTNTGNVALTNVSVTDALTSDCEVSIGDLTAGESQSYDYVGTAVDELRHYDNITARAIKYLRRCCQVCKFSNTRVYLAVVAIRLKMHRETSTDDLIIKVMNSVDFSGRRR